MSLIKEILKYDITPQMIKQSEAVSFNTDYYAYIITLNDGKALLVAKSKDIYTLGYSPLSEGSTRYVAMGTHANYVDAISHIRNADLFHLNWEIFSKEGSDFLCEFMASSDAVGNFYTGWLGDEEVQPEVANVILNSPQQCISITKNVNEEHQAFAYVEFDSVEELESALLGDDTISDPTKPKMLLPLIGLAALGLILINKK